METNFLSFILLFKATRLYINSEDLLQHLNWPFQSLWPVQPKKGNVFNRQFPRAFLGNFYLFILPVSGQKGQISGFCYCTNVVMASLIWMGKHCILSEVTLCLNRGLCGTFLTEKLLNLAILTLFQSNIFFAILGYREISQRHGWCMSRSCALRPFPWESFLTGLKGIEINVAHSVFRNMTGKKNKISPDPKSIGNSSGDQNQICMLEYLERFGCLFVSYGKAIAVY